jgi:hypothetical protein
MSALVASSTASWCRRSGSRAGAASRSAATCSARRARIVSGLRAGEASASHGADRGPFALAHGDEIGQSPVEAGEHVLLEGGFRFRVTLVLAVLDDAADGEDAVEGRRLDGKARTDALHRGKHVGKSGLVDAQALRGRIRFQRQGGLDVAAGEALAAALADLRLERLVAGRQAEAELEALAVDAAHLPRPAHAARRAVGAGKSRHACERHDALPPIHSRRQKG